MSGFPLVENRSGLRSRVRATYAVSRGTSPRRVAQLRKRCIATESLARLAVAHPLQTGDASLAPLVDALRREPTDAHQHIDRGDELSLLQGGLRRSVDSLLELLHGVRVHLHRDSLARTAAVLAGVLALG